MIKVIRIKLFFFLVLFVLLGLFREYVFVNINNVIYFKYYKNTTMPIPFGFGWLTQFSYSVLYYMKYPLTVLFVTTYFFLNLYFLRQMGVHSFYRRILILAYTLIVVISSALMLYAYYVNQKLNEEEYFISRGLMGLAQSPLISLVLFVLYLWDKNKQYHHEKRNADI